MIYANVLEAKFEYDRALETYNEGSNIGKLSLGLDHFDLVCSQIDIESIFQKRGQYDEAA